MTDSSGKIPTHPVILADGGGSDPKPPEDDGNYGTKALAGIACVAIIATACYSISAVVSVASEKISQHLVESLSFEEAEADIIPEVSDLGPNKINHILQVKHLWSNVVSDPNDRDQVSGVISKTMREGVEEPYKDVFSKTLDINGNTVEVTYTKLGDGTIKISDAWVRH